MTLIECGGVGPGRLGQKTSENSEEFRREFLRVHLS